MNTATLFFGLIFGSMGMGFFVYGKKRKKIAALTAGIGLCVIPYFISNEFLLCAIGILLTIIPFVIRI